MKCVKEYSGKSVDELIEEAEKDLNKSKDELEITVLEEAKKKLFGQSKVKISVSYEADETEDNGKPVEEETASSGKTDGERVVEFLDGLFEKLNVDVKTTLRKEGEKIEINVVADKSNELIGKHGAVLDAIQTLAGAVANKGHEKYKRVVVDCENYRENREETLKKLADNLASKAERLERRIYLEPMSAYERRIIHAHLSDNAFVKTESQGEEPKRYVVIVPNNENPELSPIPAREERQSRSSHGGNRGGYNNRRRSFDRNRENARSAFKKKNASIAPSSDFFGTFLGNSKDDDNND